MGTGSGESYNAILNFFDPYSLGTISEVILTKLLNLLMKKIFTNIIAVKMLKLWELIIFLGVQLYI